MVDTTAVSKSATTSLRLDDGVLARADALATQMADHPTYKGLQVSRHGVLRMAIDRGLQDLEHSLAQTQVHEQT